MMHMAELLRWFFLERRKRGVIGRQEEKKARREPKSERGRGRARTRTKQKGVFVGSMLEKKKWSQFGFPSVTLSPCLCLSCQSLHRELMHCSAPW